MRKMQVSITTYLLNTEYLEIAKKRIIKHDISAAQDSNR